jgi:toxin FitB
MRYLLDTNIVSEIRKKRPNEGLIAFMSAVDPDSLYLSVLTLGELRKGVAQKHRTGLSAARQLEMWVDGLESNFADRILGIDAATASLWGKLSAHRTRPVVDTLLAATAIVNNLTLVTRNTSDLRGIDVNLHNPFTSIN